MTWPKRCRQSEGYKYDNLIMINVQWCGLVQQGLGYGQLVVVCGRNEEAPQSYLHYKSIDDTRATFNAESKTYIALLLLCFVYTLGLEFGLLCTLSIYISIYIYTSIHLYLNILTGPAAII